MRITVTIETGRDGAADLFTSLANLLGESANEVTVVPAGEPEPQPEAEAPKTRRRRAKADAAPIEEPEPPVQQEPVAEELPAYEAIMAAQAGTPAAEVHDFEVMRDKVRGLMLDTLGITWARKYVLPRHGSLSAVPDSDLPALLAQAEADNADVLSSGADTWGRMIEARAADEAAAVTA